MSKKLRDQKMADEIQKRTTKELFLASERNRLAIERSGGIERGYPVVSSWPTGVSDGFIVFNTYSRRLHMYDGTTWISIGDVGAYLSLMQTIPYLRGFWGMNSLHLLVNVQEQGAQGRALAITNATFDVRSNRVSYAIFNGTTAYLERTNESGLSFSTAMMIGCWVKLTGTATQVIMSKHGAAGQYSYELGYVASTGFFFQTSGDGTVIQTVYSSHTSPGTTDWYHIVGRYISSTEIAIFVNGVKSSNVTSIPATLFTSTANFAIGRRPTALFYSSSWVTMAFISALAMDTAYVTALYEEGIPLFT